MALMLLLLAGCPAEEHEDDDGAVEGRVASLETLLADLTSRHDQEQADLEADLTLLADGLATLDGRVDSAESELGDLDARVGELEAEVADLAAGVDLTPLESALENHETRIATLEGANLASQDWVDAQGFAAETWVANQGFATQAWVTA
jgi:chromosome segregation ATPase